MSDESIRIQYNEDLIRGHLRHWHGHCVDLLHALVFKSESAADKARQAALRQMAEAAVSKLDGVGIKQGDDEWMDWRVNEKARVVDGALVAKLLNVLGKLGASALRPAAVEKFKARPAVFDPVTILVSALATIGEWDAAVKRLWEHGAEFPLQLPAALRAIPQGHRRARCADGRGGEVVLGKQRHIEANRGRSRACGRVVARPKEITCRNQLNHF